MRHARRPLRLRPVDGSPPASRVREVCRPLQGQLQIPRLFLPRSVPSPRFCSTDFSRQSGIGWNALHGCTYSRWTRQYNKPILRLPPSGSSRQAARAGGWLGGHDHGKILTHDHPRAIANLDHTIPVHDLEQMAPYLVACGWSVMRRGDVICRQFEPSASQGQTSGFPLRLDLQGLGETDAGIRVAGVCRRGPLSPHPPPALETRL
jgi:hypothetical protein